MSKSKKLLSIITVLTILMLSMFVFYEHGHHLSHHDSKDCPICQIVEDVGNKTAGDITIVPAIVLMVTLYIGISYVATYQPYNTLVTLKVQLND